MSDSLSPLPDFLGDDADEELVFDDEALVPAPAAPAPAAEDAKPSRGPRHGRKSKNGADEAAAQPEAPAAEAPIATESAEAPLHASAEEPAGGAPAPFPPHGTEPAGSPIKPWLLGIVALATVSSFASLGGLLMVSRTLAHAEADRAEAARDRVAYARVPELVARLDAASIKLDSATAHAVAASPNGPPATITDMRHELDLLKLALAQHKPDGLDAINSNMRGSFLDMATRLDRISAQLGGGRAAPAPRPTVMAEHAAAPVEVSHTAGPAPRGHVIVRAVHPKNGTAFKD